MLRPPTLADADGAAPYLADPEVMRFLGGETVPREDAGKVVQRWIDAWEANGVGKFVVETHAGVPLGRVGINVWDARTWEQTTFAASGPDARPELAWALAREHWGFGYATEAAAAVREWARRLDPLISLIAPDNVRSARVAERLGATRGEEVAGGSLVVWRHPSSR